MNDVLIIYSSKSGFTEKYAHWIAEELTCEAVKLHDLDSAKLKSAKTLIYGGPIHAGWVSGLQKFLRHPERQVGQNVFVFAVGLSPADSQDIKKYQTSNLTGDDKQIPWFYFQGGIDIDRLKGFEKMLLKLIVETGAKAQRKAELKKGKKSEPVGNPLKQDLSNRDAIKPLVEAVRAIA